jgi:cytochrome oxidase assembly protein ShyY1
MSQALFSTRSVFALTLLVAVGAGCVALGLWQLDRAAERRAIAATIAQGRSANPLNLNATTVIPHALANWTPAAVQGYWRSEYSVLLDNRNLEGRPGLWLATPLEMADGRAILVLRGWFARPIGDKKAPVVSAPQELQNLKGELSEHVPRLFELWSSNKQSELSVGTQQASGQSRLSSNKQPDGDPRSLGAIDTATLPRLQNLTIAELEKHSGLTLLPVVLLQTSPANDALIRVWPEPSVDADKNVGYAMQWFGFATICLIALIVFGWRARRHG